MEVVLQSFEEEYESSLVVNKLALDTSAATVDETLDEFREKIDAFITDEDRGRIVTRRAMRESQWT